MRTLASLLVVLLAVGAAGCGGDDEGESAEPAAAPSTITAAASEPATSAESAAETILPPTTATTAVAPPAGISAADALASPDGAQVTVSAALIDAAMGPVLCDATTRSLPPQCVGDGLPVDGIAVADAPGVQTDGGVAWTAIATVSGTMQGGTLTGATFAS